MGKLFEKELLCVILLLNVQSFDAFRFDANANNGAALVKTSSVVPNVHDYVSNTFL